LFSTFKLVVFVIIKKGRLLDP